MTFFKKTLAVATLVAVAVQSSSASAAVTEVSPLSDYAYPEYSSYVPPKELKKLANLEYRVVSTFDNAVKKELSKIRDPKVRKFYSDLNETKKSAAKSVFRNLRSDMKYAYSAPETENVKDTIRFVAKGYSEFVSEVRAAAAKNGFGTVSAEEKASVEAEIVSFQKDLVVTPLRPIVDAYAKSDVKETGDWKGSVKTPFGNVNASIERYTSVLSILGLSQEADFVLKSDFDLELPGPSKYDPETFERLPSESVRTKGAVMFDANVKIIDDFAYVLLRDYAIDVTVSGSGTEESSASLKDEIDQAKATLSLFKGKTVKIAVPKEDGASRPDVVLKKAVEILDVLESESLFTPSRKISENRYGLSMNAKTVALLGRIVEQKTTVGDIRRADKSMAAAGLAFERKDGVSTIRAIDPKGSGEAFMKRDASGYAFHFENIENSSRTSLDVSRNEAKIVSRSKYSNVVGTWKNGETELVVETMGTESFAIRGTLLAKKADLTVSVSKKPVGTFKMSKEGSSYSGEIRIEFELPEGMLEKSGNVTIESSQRAKVETGTFKIETPKDVVDIEKLLK